MSLVKLNQIVAVEKGAKERVHKELTTLYQSMNKVEPMSGISREYRPVSDDGEKLPPENKYVQVNVMDKLARMRAILTDIFDITLTKDFANTVAVADVIVDGVVILSQVPATHLLYLEKQLVDVRTVLAALPKLDPAEKWTWDEQQGFFKSDPVQTSRSKKTTEWVVVPGSGVPEKGVAPQIKEVSNDVLAGYWTTVKFSATMEPTRIAELVQKTETLLRAVKFAREQANTTEVEQKKEGSAIFDFIFG